jgi:NADP-dependent 3-hydroxy acid dehydrogenase YdfG
MKKVVLITGASSGLGESIGKYLTSQGHIVYGASRTIETQKKSFHVLNMDVTDEESIRMAVQKLVQEQGRIDVLINNAGLGIASPIETLTSGDMDKVWNTNVKGVIRTCQAVIPVMRSIGSGLIINISSIGAENGLPYRGLYSASKAAVDRITEAMRLELSQFGIQSCIIQPGGIQTDINSNRLKADVTKNEAYKENFEAVYKLINQSVENGLLPDEFGILIEKLLHKKHIKRLYRVGKPVEKLSVLLKHILPSGRFEKLIKGHYKMK